MNVKSQFDWLSPLKTGLLGGTIALFVALVGVVEVSHVRPVIPGVLSLGQTLLLLILVLFGYQAMRQARTAQEGKTLNLWIIASSALAVLVTTGLLAALVLIGQVINLRTIFVNASPALFDLLTFELGTGLGTIVLLIFGAGLGAITAVISLLPTRIGKSLVLGLALVPTVGILNSALFSGRGISLWAAPVVFVVVAGGSYFWSGVQPQVQNRIDNLDPDKQKLFQRGRRILPVLIVLLLPLLGSYPSQVLDLVGLYALMGLGLNIVVGFAGLLDLGYVAFFALGAYTMGVLTSPEIDWLGIHLTFWEALPFAVLVSTLAGIILGIPVLGMRGDYLAIVTLGFGEIIRLVFGSDWLKPYIGGSNGITRIPKAVLGPVALKTPGSLYYLILLGCLIAAFVATRVKDSRLGRAWMALREDEDVAQAMGIDLIRVKLMAFATGAAFSGLSGAIFASMLTSVYPHSFNLLVSINVLCLIIVGGMGSIPGAIVGSLVLVGLPEVLREFSEHRLLVYGAALVYMMLTLPEGLMPEERRKLELHEAEIGGGE